MSDNNFVGGFFARAPHERAPGFVKASVSIKLADFAAYLREVKQDNPDIEWLRIQIKESRGGKWYAERDTWEPNQAQATNGGDSIDDTIPF
jgi:hypothetical protein